METMRNRPIMLAKFLRNATQQLRALERRADDGAVIDRRNALDSIDAVAGVLEEQAAAPDPAGAAS